MSNYTQERLVGHYILDYSIENDRWFIFRYGYEERNEGVTIQRGVLLDAISAGASSVGAWRVKVVPYEFVLLAQEWNAMAKGKS